MVLIVGGALVAFLLLKRLSFVSAEAARKHLAEGALVIDVRSPEEFGRGHVANAVNIPLGELGDLAPKRWEDKSQVLLLHCLSGGRSGLAKQRLKRLGYTNVYNLGSYGRAERIVAGKRAIAPREAKANKVEASEARLRVTMKEHALAVFRRRPERLNCAQAVLHAWREISGDKALEITAMKGFGAGRAPDGVCGALHAACVIAPGQAEALKAAFAKSLGSIRCRELRKAGEHACDVCVAESAELLDSRRNIPRQD